jgi:excisionase family DNA binding protein
MPKLEHKRDTISIVEAARRLNVEVNYAYRPARSGRLEARKAGRHRSSRPDPWRRGYSGWRNSFG